jgi:alanyl-tRNA synthetase
MEIRNNISSIDQIRSQYLKGQNTTTETKTQPEESFAKIFEERLKFSRHADERLATRGINLTGKQMERLNQGMRLASEKGITVDEEGFKEKFKEHQEKSRAGSEAKFKGGLAGNGEMETKYHTATHLLNAALKRVVGPDVHQKGSNITAERMRFDFSCDHKLSDEEKNEAEKLVNEWIAAAIDVVVEEMPKDEAIKSGAECMFIEKYPDVVTVYTIGDVSKELCGGPHVKNTSELGKFVIKKEEASSAGVRRIKAILE